MPYTDRDHEAIRTALIGRIPSLTDRWTDHNASDAGIVLLELLAGVGDMLSYYLDQQTNEAFLPTARQRQSIIDLCQLIGYRLDLPIAATTELEFRLPVPLSGDLLIPAHTVCVAPLNDGSVYFETMTDATIMAGETTAQTAARQGKRKTETFPARPVRWQQIRLNNKAIANKTVEVWVGGERWTEVESFIGSNWAATHFTVAPDPLGTVTITFGDGVRGLVPPSGESITVQYLETLGPDGNVGPSRITDLVGDLYLDSVQQPVQVRNVVAATGGAAAETIEHARQHAPAELRSLWKAVTKADYESLATGFPGIAKALVMDTNDCQNIRYYQVNLVVAPNGGGYCAPALKAELGAFLEARKVITTEVRLYDPVYRDVEIDADVWCYSTEDPALVQSRVEATLTSWLHFDRVTFGQNVYPSDLISIMDNTDGVSHVELTLPSNWIILRPGELPRLGDVNLRVRRTGG